jgi:hypothetical protein
MAAGHSNGAGKCLFIGYVVYSGQPEQLWANDEITLWYLIITSLVGCRQWKARQPLYASYKKSAYL